MTARLELTGQKFNRLTVISFSHVDKISFWNVKCDCGSEFISSGNTIKNGHTKSCGCLNEEKRKTNNLKHNASKTKLYKTWIAMIQRCKNVNNEKYKSYGGRGISVCEEWLDFNTFKKDVGEKPLGKTLDRIDNNGDYCKENCRWATYKEQGNNRRTNINITYNNKTKNLMQWAQEIDVDPQTLSNKLFKYNWTMEKVIANKNIHGNSRAIK